MNTSEIIGKKSERRITQSGRSGRFSTIWKK
jgi:hypothetical protein